LVHPGKIAKKPDAQLRPRENHVGSPTDALTKYIGAAAGLVWVLLLRRKR
jgi:hypothetical protein